MLSRRPAIALHGSRYFIQQSYIMDWHNLVPLLSCAGAILLEASNVQLPLYFAYPRSPLLYGSDHGYTTKRGAYKAIQRTLDAFNLLIAFCTFAHILPKVIPACKVLIRDGVLESWIDMFLSSEIVSSRCRRVRFFLDLVCWQLCSEKLLQTLSTYMPMWIHWGTPHKISTLDNLLV